MCSGHGLSAYVDFRMSFSDFVNVGRYLLLGSIENLFCSIHKNLHHKPTNGVKISGLKFNHMFLFCVIQVLSLFFLHQFHITGVCDTAANNCAPNATCMSTVGGQFHLYL